MRTLVESLQRLHTSSKITIDKLNTILSEGTITQEEYDYVIGSV